MNLDLKDILAIWGAITGSIGTIVGIHVWRLNRRLSTPRLIISRAAGKIVDEFEQGFELQFQCSLACESNVTASTPRLRSTSATCLLILACWAAGVATTFRAAHGSEPDPLYPFLQHDIKLSAAEIAVIEAGGVVSKVLDTVDKEEIAVFAAVWIEAPIALFLERYRDIETFERSPAVHAIGEISVPPSLEDFAALQIPEKDIKDIRKCRPGKCDVKLTNAAIERFQSEVDWSAANAFAQANALARQLALEAVEVYIEGGVASLGHYWDKEHPQELAAEFQTLLDHSPYIETYTPGLASYLRSYPQVALPESEEFFYWSTVEFGLKPLLRINHVNIKRLGEAENAEAVIASTNLYSSHYFRAALELRYLLHDRKRLDAGFYLVSINRARADGLTGIIGSILGRKIRNRSRDRMATFLKHAKLNTEAAHRGEAP
jgi:hypothetical protein